jgi:hypothetical protein
MLGSLQCIICNVTCSDHFIRHEDSKGHKERLKEWGEQHPSNSFSSQSLPCPSAPSYPNTVEHAISAALHDIEMHPYNNDDEPIHWNAFDYTVPQPPDSNTMSTLAGQLKSYLQGKIDLDTHRII